MIRLKLTGSDVQAKFKRCRALAVNAVGNRLSSRQVAEMLAHGPGFAVICSKKNQPEISDPRFKKWCSVFRADVVILVLPTGRFRSVEAIAASFNRLAHELQVN